MILQKEDWPRMKGKLEDLFFQTFGRHIHPDYLDWRYINNGQPNLFFNVHFDKDIPVSSYSIFPVDLLAEGKTYKTSLSMTTMTHPSARGKGLISLLANELYSYAARSGIITVWGFPNSNFHGVAQYKLGWSDIYEVPTMYFDYNKAISKTFDSDGSIDRDDSFGLKYGNPPHDQLIRVNRTSNYLKWRYLQNPLNNYRNYVILEGEQVHSYIITKNYDNGVDLVDIQVATIEEAYSLISHIISENQNTEKRYIYCWAPTHHFIHGVLERLGFLNSAPITYFAGRELISNSAPPEWLNYRNWYLQMADSDVY